ncbi:dynamin family protein [Simplicispira psychrophila]|uniref:dynamin family protein n=1 Tax=Simplicispira psychrophila TaxID=80882 RepID=UPI000480C73F|nr:dynamin family protein [Simplicispira psychrophila]
MTEKSISREALLASFGTLATQFTSSLQETQVLEKTFDASRAKLVEAISSHLQNAQKSLPKSNPLQASLSHFVVTMAQTSREWDAKVAGRQKGVKFRQGFEDSLLVFVSGKVKSGKSSLGNYVAWGHTDPTDDIKRETLPERHPTYKSHDRKNVEGGDSDQEAAKKREFRVGATEATSSIQSFSLSGLTWVDSPGLHSMKEENGNLAREYLDHADLILYTMKSDAPGRASDLAEIRDLIYKEKRTLLLLTGSDDIEEDINDSGDLIQCIVMKDAERRAKQQDYVRGELKELLGSDKLEIVSISSRYAQERAHDPVAFLDSGIGSFCATLQDICQSEGVKIKQRVPMKNLHHFLGDCENDLVPYEKLMTDFRPALRKLNERLKNQISQHSREGQHDLKRFIDTFFVGLESNRGDADHITSQLKNFNNKLGEKFQEIANERVQAIVDDLTKEFQSSVKSTYQHSLLAQIPDFKIDTITEQVEAGTRSGTKKRNSLLGTIGGGLIGFVVGGPAGAAIGAGLGGGLGGATGDSASIRYRDVQIIVGDNLQDIRRKLLDTYCEALNALLEKTLLTYGRSLMAASKSF